MFNFPGQGGPPGMGSHSLAMNPFAMPPGMPGMQQQQQQQMAQAWFKLTTSGGRWSQNKKCISGNDFPLPKPVVPRMRLDDPISV
eukprot:symbB.v1.2.005554.t1/scaffold258.1/size251559/8